METITTFLKDNIRLLLGAAVVIFAAILLITFIINGSSKKVTVNGVTYNVRVVEEEKEKQIGLSQTDKLKEDEGMLFLFDKPGLHSFWMKEMKFPIDIIFIRDNTVTSVVGNALPPTQTGGDLEIYEPTDASNKVLEIKAGEAKKNNIKKGTIVEIKGL